MIAFLRLFPVFRMYEKAAEEKTRLQDRVIALEDKVRLLTSFLEQAQEDAREARKETITVLREQSARPAVQPTPRSGVQGRVLQIEATRRFYDELNGDPPNA